MPALTEQFVRETLLTHWGQQACQNPADWPRVLAALMKDAPASRDTSPDSGGRGSLKPAVDEAVAALTTAFANGPPSDPLDAVWRAFPRLHREHRAALAAALTEAGNG